MSDRAAQGNEKFVEIFMAYPMQDVHTNAMAAALAAECANEQGKFWIYHDILYSNNRFGKTSMQMNYQKY